LYPWSTAIESTTNKSAVTYFVNQTYTSPSNFTVPIQTDGFDNCANTSYLMTNNLANNT